MTHRDATVEDDRDEASARCGAVLTAETGRPRGSITCQQPARHAGPHTFADGKVRMRWVP